jgi:hypothetical protein
MPETTQPEIAHGAQIAHEVLETSIRETAYWHEQAMDAGLQMRNYKDANNSISADLREARSRASVIEEMNNLLQSQFSLANAALEHPELALQAMTERAITAERRIDSLTAYLRWAICGAVAGLLLFGATVMYEGHRQSPVPDSRNAPTPSVRVNG